MHRWGTLVVVDIPSGGTTTTVQGGWIYSAAGGAALDPTAPDDVLELKDPILVPPCGP